MSITFNLTVSIPVELSDPGYIARCVVEELTNPDFSLDDLMSTFFCFFPELVFTLQETDAPDPRTVFLATAVLHQFYHHTLDGPVLDPIIAEHLEVVTSVLVPVMLHALEFYTDPEMDFYRPEDTVVLATLAVLLKDEKGISQFGQTEPSRLKVQIKSIVDMWINVSGTTSITTIDLEILKIIRLLSAYGPTRGPLAEVLEGIPCSQFCRGLTRLNSAVLELDNSSFSSLPRSLLTNMRGLALMATIRPKLNDYLCRHGLIKSLCSLLAYAVIDRPRMVSSATWTNSEKFSAYTFVTAICGELRVFLGAMMTDSCRALLVALNTRLLESIYAALQHFGRASVTGCSPMAIVLRFIGEWAMKSRRVAHKVLTKLTEFKRSESWDGLPQMPSGHPLVKGWYKFLVDFELNVQVSAETGRLDTVCMWDSCNERGKKRCQTCKVLIICSEACFKTMCDSGEHTCRRI